MLLTFMLQQISKYDNKTTNGAVNSFKNIDDDNICSKNNECDT